MVVELHAPYLRYSAICAFELQRGVTDVKIIGQEFIDVWCDLFRILHAHTSHKYMGIQSMDIGANAPDMNVMESLNAFDIQDFPFQLFNVDVFWCSLHQYIHRFPQQPKRTEDDDTSYHDAD